MILLVYLLCIPSFVLTGYCFSELHAHSVPNVWPEACFTIVHMLVLSELWVPITSPSFVCLHLLVSEIANVLLKGVYVVLQELHCLLQ